MGQRRWSRRCVDRAMEVCALRWALLTCLLAQPPLSEGFTLHLPESSEAGTLLLELAAARSCELRRLWAPAAVRTYIEPGWRSGTVRLSRRLRCAALPTNPFTLRLDARCHRRRHRRGSGQHLSTISIHTDIHVHGRHCIAKRRRNRGADVEIVTLQTSPCLAAGQPVHTLWELFPIALTPCPPWHCQLEDGPLVLAWDGELRSREKVCLKRTECIRVQVRCPNECGTGRARAAANVTIELRVTGESTWGSSSKLLAADQDRGRPRRWKRNANTGPQFQPPIYQVSVAENMVPGARVVTVRAVDPDEGESGRLEYSMNALFDSRSNSLFVMEPATGAVITAESLDRETKDIHVFRVMAVDHGSPRRTAMATLTVTVSDANDHDPLFEQREYKESVRENLEIGYEVLTVRATDGDAPPNANILYQILNGQGQNQVFEIDPRSGVMRTRGPVDRESVESYQLLVEANDQGRNPGPRSSTATVHITVEDDNDNTPQFSEKRYVVQVLEDVAPNTQVLQVTASDRDKGNNALVHYSIMSGNTRGQFYIDAHSGSIDVVSRLDYETNKEYTLRIRAQDGGRPPLSNITGMVSVMVVDVNDNAPMFVSTPFQSTVLENVPVGYSIIHVQAIDADSGNNSRLEYRLTDSPPDSPFSINNNTGWLVVGSELDRETTAFYRFGVEARDQGSPPMSSTASISITVLDVNDNNPEFTQPLYQVRLNEDAAVGSSVVTVSAIDRDVNSLVTYQISSGNTRNRFSITSQSGGGLITLALPLDYKLERQYILTVTASDGTRLDTVKVFINVTDANTHRPVFQSSHYTVNINEDRPVGTTVVIISATDEDTGENARITYFMEDSIPQFKIEPDSGAVTTLMDLDYEDQVSYTLAITAKDNGIPQKSDTTYLEILVNDVNDNAPQFLRDHYQGSIYEDVPTFTSVVQVSATDRDSGLNGRVFYTFQGGDDGEGDFIIETTSGIVRTLRRLDRENVQVYQLKAFAVDKGVPAMRTPINVQVMVMDVNDNPPVFEKDEFDIFVDENSPIGLVVTRITATDPDEGTNAQIMYQIVEGNIPEVFQLDIFSGELTALMDLDYETKSEYVIVVQATSAPLVSRATIHLRLVDKNDNVPVLKNFEIIFNNYVTNKSSSFPSGIIGRIPAHDPDVSDSLYYNFDHGNELNLVFLNQTTGELSLSHALDNNRPLEATMRVSVSDGIHSVTAQCTLQVTIITDEMLSNSITLRLENMSQDRFLSPLLSLFVEGVATVLAAMKEDIVIFNIQNDTDVKATILNVSLSVLVPGGAHNQFFSSEDLQEQIYLNRTLLTAISTQTVLPFDDNICLREPCENYMKCVSVLKFDSSAPFITSNTILFRPIHPINGLRCRCPAGFTGDYCETEIDLCYSNPCGNHGTCRSREGGFTCECHEDYTGHRCEVNTRSGRCSPGICRNGGACVNLLVGGFKCECLPGEYERPYCDVTTRSFPRQSFITFKGLRQRFHFSLSLMFATKEKNALLLYNGRFNEKHDFIALEIINEQIQLTFSAGESTSMVSPYIPGGVSDGQWHTVHLRYYNKPMIGKSGVPQGPSEQKVAVVTVDDCDTSVALRFGSLIGNYSCSAQGTQSGSKKSLDLTGPLLLGGVPNLPEDFPLQNHEFMGCMKNLLIDNQQIDMADFIANNGTVTGCSAKWNFCDSNTCKNGGTCVNRWETFSCECPLGFGGKNCEQVMASPQRFLGNSRVSWTNLAGTITLPWCVAMMFRTRQETGTFIQADAGQFSTLTIQLREGNVMLNVYRSSSQVTALTMDQIKVNDGDWHHLQLELKSSRDGTEAKYTALISIDYGLHQTMVEIGNELHGLKLKTISIGGVPDNNGSVLLGFRGCMQGVRIGETPVTTVALNVNHAEKVNVERGCSLPDPCDSSPCPTNSYCNDDWDSYSCSCDPGYYGEECKDVCSLNPCEHLSVCSRKPSSSHGYTCDCSSNFFGQYCETKIDQPCARGWWGHPVCGPCDCDVRNGFDADCNKTSGECRCKDNYYWPAGSNACLPCDCYSMGSLSRPCDMETGQCQCKPGVIGQHCDRCDNPFAEVFINGCEVIYDSCPRAMEAGIWWPRTKFGLPAAVPCPKGSTGTGIRHCDEHRGWLPPDLFNCTTNTFAELKTLAEKLKRNETVLDMDKSKRIALQLWNATQHTRKYFGSDVKIAYHVTSKILEFENSQRGFNLAATQDVQFTENLIEVGSSILDASNKRHWDLIQQTDGGAAHLLKHYEDYASALAQNMRKTYLSPFTIVTPNIVISVDRLHKANFSGVKLPRYDFIRGEKPRDLETIAILPESIFTPAEIKESSKVPTPSPEEESTPLNRKRRHPDPIEEDAIVSIIIYWSLGELLPEQYDPDKRSLRVPKRPVINSPVVTVAVHDHDELLQHQLEKPIRVQYRLFHTEERTKPICVFWNHSIPLGVSGGWSSKGCELIFRNASHISCQCHHMTSFAVLMDISRRENGEILPLKLVTYSTVGVTLGSLFFSFLLLLMLRSLHSNQHSISKNMVVALFMSELIFLLGINQADNAFVCTVIAILLHFFYMCTFAWMLLEGLHIYRMLTEVRDINYGPMRFYYMIGWGVPAFITGLAVGLDPEGYGNPDFCWLSIYDTLIWSFAGPISAAVSMNVFLYILSTKASCRPRHQGFEKKGTVSGLRTAFVVLLLVSTTWLLALLAVNSDTIIFHYLFAGFNCLQGPFIFIFRCILNKEVRKAFKNVFSKKNSNDTVVTTKSTLASQSLCNNTYIDGRTYRSAFGDSTGSVGNDSRSGKSHNSYIAFVLREEAALNNSGSSQAHIALTDHATSLFHEIKANPDDHDSDSDSDLSLEDDQSGSYASTHSSDSEDDEAYRGEPGWENIISQNNEHHPNHSTPKVENIPAHDTPCWPGEFMMMPSQGEEHGGSGNLNVETVANIELHQEKLNHVDERPKENGDDLYKEDVLTSLPNPTTQPQRGILKNKGLPLFSERNSINRIHNELSNHISATVCSRASSVGSSEGSRSGGVTKLRQAMGEQINGVMPIPMSIKTGTVDEDSSGSDSSGETSI
ncbi:cadherin EGF LAG seven-pass G-type receptor 2 isoform X3 [Amblyraja radiata]|uniref:cadherin EGF LAG seven-pass G-type receptor 2 isoform X3 n=1 Tax=Amblyraja radiata TaxID=386614 RepID=UPI00140249D3|nr:cadherin EGF LAG seven-pass G-type receptor 2 isoform X3 [Amblyraja radiata]